MVVLIIVFFFNTLTTFLGLEGEQQTRVLLCLFCMLSLPRLMSFCLLRTANVVFTNVFRPKRAMFMSLKFSNVTYFPLIAIVKSTGSCLAHVHAVHIKTELLISQSVLVCP